MPSQTSAVLVAVRVRPFNSRESPHECTVTVADPTTITVTDVGEVNRSSASIGGSLQCHVFKFDKIFWSIPVSVLPLPSTHNGHSQRLASAASIRLSATDSSPSPCSHSPSEPATVRRSSNSSETSAACSIGAGDGCATAAACVRSSLSRLPCFAQVPSCDDQTAVYSFIGPLMYESAMTGYNSCLFAYGQTGSGKTYSMIGPHDNFSENRDERGIIQRLCEDLFDMMRREREEDEGISYSVECSFFEIYCERVRDLLAHTVPRDIGDAYPVTSTTSMGSVSNLRLRGSPSQSLVLTPRQGCSNSSPQLRIRQHPAHGPYVEGLSHVKVRDVEGVMRQLIFGLRERATAETRMNEHSSRSHALLQLNITRVSAVREAEAIVTRTRTCKVSLVDLAGSERISQSGATGERFEEARNINQSLTTLTRVIMQLTDKQAGNNVVPSYRDSALTWLLSDSLGGNSKTIMLATVAPSAYCYQQTLNTLRFAGVTKKVINVATVNEDQRSQKLITSLREQIVKLTMRIEEGKTLEPQQDEVRKLRRDKAELEMRLETLRIKMSKMVPASDLDVLRRRVAESEEENARLHAEKCNLHRQLMSTTMNLRGELLKRRSEVVKLGEALSKKEAEVLEWKCRHHSEVFRSSKPPGQPSCQFPRDATASVRKIKSHNNSSKANGSQRHGLSKGEAASIGNDSAIDVAGESIWVGIDELQLQKQELQQQMLQLTDVIRSEQRRREDAEEEIHSLRCKLRSLGKLHDSARVQLEEAERKLLEKSHALEAAEISLASTRALLSSERNGGCATEREAALENQMEDLRVEYLGEKQSNVDLLMRVSRMERQLSFLQHEAERKAQDVCELEQMLLEETEASERYYVFQMYYHDRFNICQALNQEVMGMKGCGFVHTFGSVNGVAQHSLMDGRLSMCGKTMYNCEWDEMRSRLLLKEEWFEALSDLWMQRDTMWRMSVSALGGEVTPLRVSFAESEEEQQRPRRKLEMSNTALEEVVLARSSIQATLTESEEEQGNLRRRVEDLEEELETQRRRNEMLVTKVAGAQAVGNAHCESEGGIGDSEDGSIFVEEVLERQCFSSSSPKRDMKELLSEVELYKERVNELTAEMESERSSWRGLQATMERELESQQQELQRVRSGCKASLFESTQIVREYEARFQEMQDVIETLRTTLVEEGTNVDLAREEVRRARVANCDLNSELRRVTEAKDSMKKNLEETNCRLADVEQRQQCLKRELLQLEQRLLELSKMHEVDVYLSVKCGGEDSGWVEKAVREKEAIEQQKRVVQKLSRELLETITESSATLRDMDRQIALLQHDTASNSGVENPPQDMKNEEG